jgi:hypothetical protein
MAMVAAFAFMVAPFTRDVAPSIMTTTTATSAASRATEIMRARTHTRPRTRAARVLQLVDSGGFPPTDFAYTQPQSSGDDGGAGGGLSVREATAAAFLCLVHLLPAAFLCFAHSIYCPVTFELVTLLLILSWNTRHHQRLACF